MEVLSFDGGDCKEVIQEEKQYFGEQIEVKTVSSMTESQETGLKQVVIFGRCFELKEIGGIRRQGTELGPSAFRKALTKSGLRALELKQERVISLFEDFGVNPFDYSEEIFKGKV